MNQRILACVTLLALLGVTFACNRKDCESDLDCPDGEFCVIEEGSAGECVAEDSGAGEGTGGADGSCSSDRECGAYVCEDGSCTDTCSADSDCGADFECIPVGGSDTGACGLAVPCRTDAVCGGYACIDGECALGCREDEDCQDEYVCERPRGADFGVCTTENVTEPTGCTDDSECGAYTCEFGTCLTFCATSSDCSDGFVCDASGGGLFGTCVSGGQPGVEYSWVAVVSTAFGEESTSADNPGPDIDAIGVERGAAVYWATSVGSAAVGQVTGGEGLTGEVQNVLGTPDDWFGPGEECLLEWETGYYAIGGSGGFVAVGFGSADPIRTGDVITVVELSGGFNGCSNISTDRPDTYEVYIGGGPAPGRVDEIVANWCLVGASDSLGGVSETVVNTARCN